MQIQNFNIVPSQKSTKAIKKIVYLLGIVIAIIFLSMLIIPKLFKEQINTSIKEITNKNINGELVYSDID